MRHPPQKLPLLAVLAVAAAAAATVYASYKYAGWMNFKLRPGDKYLAGTFVLDDDSASNEGVLWLPDNAKWDEMTASLEKQALRFPGRMGIYIKDINSGREWAYRPDELFPSASLIKVPIMAALFDRLKAGGISLEDKLVIRRGDKRGGSGTLRYSRYGTTLTVRQLMEKMITESDNTATHMLVNHIGIDYLQAKFNDMGLKYTKIYPEGLSLDSGRVERENYTTPREMAQLIERIYKGEIVDSRSSAAMLDIMKRTKNHSRFAKELPPGWKLAHKTGMLRQACHDAGIIYSPRGAYLMAVMTWKVPDYRYAANYISRLARVTYKYYRMNDAMLARRGKLNGSFESI